MKRDPAFNAPNAPYVRAFLGSFSFFSLLWTGLLIVCFGAVAVWQKDPIQFSKSFSDWALIIYLVFLFLTSCFTFLRGYLLLILGLIVHGFVLPVFWQDFREHIGIFQIELGLAVIGWWYMALTGLRLKNKPSMGS